MNQSTNPYKRPKFNTPFKPVMQSHSSSSSSSSVKTINTNTTPSSTSSLLRGSDIDRSPSESSSRSIIIPSSPLSLKNKSSRVIYSKEERELDLQIRNQMKEKDTLVKAVRYIKQEEDKKLTDLINKWRDVCFKSSNYLYNHYSIEMMKYGGKRQFRQNYLDRQSKLNQPYDELDHDNHNDDDDEEDTGNDGKRKRQSYQDYDEYEPTKYDEHPIKDDYVDDDEFTMKDLYYYLNKDHKLVYES